MPDDYLSFQVARYLGVHPVEVDEGPLYWRNRVQAFVEIEAGVQRTRKEAEERVRARGTGRR